MSEKEKVSETFWWNQDGMLECLLEETLALVVIFWITAFVSTALHYTGYSNFAFFILYTVLIAVTLQFALLIKRQKDWLIEHYGDWDE